MGKRRKIVKGGTIERLERVTIPVTVPFDVELEDYEDDDKREGLTMFAFDAEDKLVLTYETDDAEELAAWLRSLAEAVEGD